MSRLGSRVRVSVSFHKNSRLVGRLGSGVRVSASFQKNSRLVGRIGSAVLISASFQKSPPRCISFQSPDELQAHWAYRPISPELVGLKGSVCSEIGTGSFYCTASSASVSSDLKALYKFVIIIIIIFFLLLLLLLLLLLKCVNVVDFWCARKAEISKAVDMYMFLFDDILLLTRVKKASRKVRFVFTSCQALQLYMDECHLCLVASYFFVL